MLKIQLSGKILIHFNQSQVILKNVPHPIQIYHTTLKCDMVLSHLFVPLFLHMSEI